MNRFLIGALVANTGHGLSRWVRSLDERLRSGDLWLNRTTGGLMGDKVPRHTVAAVLLPTILVFFIVNGPALRPTPRLALATLIAIVTAPLFIAALRSTRDLPILRDLIGQSLLLVVIAALVFAVAPADALERDNVLLYRHVLTVLGALLATAVPVALSVWEPILFSSTRARQNVSHRLKQVELFGVSRNPPHVTRLMVLLSALQAATQQPQRLLFWPTLLVLIVEREFVRVIFGVVLLANLALLAFANLDRWFAVSWNLLHRLLFRGAATLVSLTIIVLGMCRLFDVDYVSTVFDGARNYTIGGYLIGAYVLTWWFDYWTTTLAASRFLGLLKGLGTGATSRIDYVIDAATHRIPGIPAQGRFIQLHGAGRLLVVCEPGQPNSPHYRAYDPVGLAEALHAGVADNDPVRGDLDFVKWRLEGHFLLTSLTVVLACLVTGFCIHRLPQEALIGTSDGQSALHQPLDLARVILPTEACTGNAPVIAVAASGGGTRAALYTASILERLHQQHQLQNVRIVSGVSGGAAALAYFVAYRTQLLGSDLRAWDDFFEAMKQPYIEDVIDGSGEWRVVAGHRLGHLLAESFERRWGNSRRKTMREITDIGIVLNSAIAGRFMRDIRDDASDSLARIERRSGRDGLSDVAGGRMVFTNLALPDHFGNATLIEEQSPRPTRETRLPIFVANGGFIRLSAAAAASANFPPVFSNVAIDRDTNARFWVTDGGAIDNRGTETLLMAIRYGLRNRSEDDKGRCPVLPPIHVLEVEASALSNSYGQDRGLGSMMSAGAAFASQLDAEVLQDIRQTMRAPIRFHFLPMPKRLRQSGSFGTHWMLQERITVCDDECDESRMLSGDDVVRVLRQINTSLSQTQTRPTGDNLLEFVLSKDDESKPNWERLSACLRGTCPN